MSEEVGSLELVGLYPVNALRNKALQLSQTEVRRGSAGVAGWRACGRGLRRRPVRALMPWPWLASPCTPCARTHAACTDPCSPAAHRPRAQVVLLLDADFLPNRELTDLIHDPAKYEQLRRVTGFRQVGGGAARRGAAGGRDAGVLLWRGVAGP